MRYRPSKVESGVRVEAIAGEGKGLGRINGKVIFIEQGIPGDVADVRVTQDKKDYAVGKIETLKEASHLRVQPFCQHFGVCGGCKWQNISYETQLHFKEGMVREAFRRIGKLELNIWRPIVGCDEDRYYRNKLEFTFSAFGWLSREKIDSGERFDRRSLGFHVPGKYDLVTHIETCYLMHERVNLIRNGLHAFAVENGYEYYDLLKHTGFLRNLMIRAATTGEWMVVLSFAQNDVTRIAGIMEFLREKFTFITCLQYTVNTKKNDAWHDLEIIHFAGKDHIEEKLGNIRFRISAQSFFQTNSRQAAKLYHIIKEFSGLQGTETVYDLYTGTGSIALFLAGNAKKVVGIEQISQAVEDAHQNALLNGITNAVFETGTVESLLDSDFIGRNGVPDMVITDPPRAGMHPRVVEVLLQALPQKIVYVSCNPATQARDLQLLSEAYDIEALQPVDMFPQTWHIENVALLKKRSV